MMEYPMPSKYKSKIKHSISTEEVAKYLQPLSKRSNLKKSVCDSWWVIGKWDNMLFIVHPNFDFMQYDLD